jgi:hypothetical protein
MEETARECMDYITKVVAMVFESLVDCSGLIMQLGRLRMDA